MITTIDGEQRPLTFGIELECIFAFHEVLLQDVTAANSSTLGPVKDLPYDLRALEANLNRTSRHSHREYNSWGVIDKSPVYVDSDHSEWPALAVIRPYDREPMRVASQVLRQSCNIPIKVPLCDKVAGLEYGTWHVGPDTSVMGVGSENLPKYLPDRISTTKSHSWDGFGIELISRVFIHDNDEDTNEIGNVVKAIQGTRRCLYGVFNTNQSGFHVYVHVLSPSLAALKELAYLILVLEEGINHINAPCRKPNHPTQLGGNIAFNTLVGEKDDEGQWMEDVGGFQDATTLLE